MPTEVLAEARARSGKIWVVHLSVELQVQELYDLNVKFVGHAVMQSSKLHFMGTGNTITSQADFHF